jgi:hypothetical protein
LNRPLPPFSAEGYRISENPEVWDHLDLFLRQLQEASDVNRQLNATLDMVRASTRADVVFLYRASLRQVAEWSGPQGSDLDRFAAVAKQLLKGEGPPEGHLLLQNLKGAEGAASEPHSAAFLRLSRSRGVWIVALRFSPDHPLSARDVKVMNLARRLLQQQQQQQANQDQLKEMLFSLVRCLTASLDARDPYTWGHSERVARIAVRLAEQLTLSEQARSELYLGGLLHDVGKIGVPDEALRKPGALTPEEFALIQQHVIIGDAIVGHVRQLAHLKPLVRSHHERWDGKGYPDGLAGERIPLPARILAVADSCDAMMSDRPYRKALPTERIEAIFTEGAGTQWDAGLVATFLACKDDIFPICQRGLGDSMVRAVEHALGVEHGAGAVRSFLALRPSASGLAFRSMP